MKKQTIRLICLISAIVMLLPLVSSLVACGDGTPEVTEPENQEGVG